MDSEIVTPSGVTYVAPPPDLIDDLAVEVCYALGDDYTIPYVVHGLAGLLKVIAHAQAKTLNHRRRGAGSEVTASSTDSAAKSRTQSAGRQS